MANLIDAKSPLEERLRARQGGSSWIFYTSLLLFFLAVALYGGLIFLNRAQDRARAEIMEQVRLKEEDLRPELSEQILRFDAQLKNIRTVLSQRNFPSAVTGLLEKTVHPQVRFLTFNFSAQDRLVTLGGEAASYTVLTQQIAALERAQGVEKVEFGGLNQGSNNLVNFRLMLTLAPAYLNQKP